MNYSDHLPTIVLDAFPVLANAVFSKRLASPVPAAPDTTFDLFDTSGDTNVALISTDYPDPLEQSTELFTISNGLRFKGVVVPFNPEATLMSVKEHDDIDNEYFVKDRNVYYYVARLDSSIHR